MSRLIQELAAAAAAEKGLTFEDNMVERLCAYSRAVAHFPTAVKEVYIYILISPLKSLCGLVSCVSASFIIITAV